MLTMSEQFMCRGIRGAITVEENSAIVINTATCRLLQQMQQQNLFDLADLAAAFFTVTADLNAQFPAMAARTIGWQGVPLLCASEIAVPGGLHLCIRVLLLWNTTKAANQIQHVYLERAAALRPDLASETLASNAFTPSP
jgi:chorismate mutase